MAAKILNIFSNSLERSPSLMYSYGVTKVLFELQMVHVPGLPVYSV